MIDAVKIGQRCAIIGAHLCQNLSRNFISQLLGSLFDDTSP